MGQAVYLTVLLAFKLLLAPLLIYVVTLVGRRLGPVASGFLIGLPLVSGPISFLLAYEYGLEFASRSAVGNLAGQISNCIFGLSYIAVARRYGWLASSLAAVGMFFVATHLLNQFSWQLWPAVATLAVVIAVAARAAPRYPTAGREVVPPPWDLPGRMLCAVLLVVVLTNVADRLGPQLSGLISPFPAFSVIFAAFTHAQQGARSASNLLRGVIVGSSGYASFFIVVGALLPTLGLAATYALATLAAVGVGGISFFATNRTARAPE